MSAGMPINGSISMSCTGIAQDASRRTCAIPAHPVQPLHVVWSQRIHGRLPRYFYDRMLQRSRTEFYREYLQSAVQRFPLDPDDIPEENPSHQNPTRTRPTPTALEPSVARKVVIRSMRLLEEVRKFANSSTIPFTMKLRKSCVNLMSQLHMCGTLSIPKAAMTALFTIMGGPVTLIDLFNRIHHDLLSSQNILPERIALMLATCTECFALFRNISFSYSPISKLLQHTSVIRLLFNFLRYPETSEQTCLLLEEVIRSSKSRTFRLADMGPDAMDIIMSLDFRTMPALTRVLAPLLFEREKIEGIHGVPMRELARQWLYAVRKTQIKLPDCAKVALHESDKFKIYEVQDEALARSFQNDMPSRSIIQENCRLVLSEPGLLARIMLVLSVPSSVSPEQPRSDSGYRPTDRFTQIWKHFASSYMRGIDEFQCLVTFAINDSSDMDENSAEDISSSSAILCVSGRSLNLGDESVVPSGDSHHARLLSTTPLTADSAVSLAARQSDVEQDDLVPSSTASRNVTDHAMLDTPGFVLDHPPITHSTVINRQEEVLGDNTCIDVSPLATFVDNHAREAQAVLGNNCTETEQMFAVNQSRLYAYRIFNLAQFAVLTMPAARSNPALSIMYLACANYDLGLTLTHVLNALMNGQRGRGAALQNEQRRLFVIECIERLLRSQFPNDDDETLSQVLQLPGIFDSHYVYHAKDARSRPYLYDDDDSENHICSVDSRTEHMNERVAEIRRILCMESVPSLVKRLSITRLRTWQKVMGASAPSTSDLRVCYRWRQDSAHSLVEIPEDEFDNWDVRLYSRLDNRCALFGGYKPFWQLDELLQQQNGEKMRSPLTLSRTKFSQANHPRIISQSSDSKAIFADPDCVAERTVLSHPLDWQALLSNHETQTDYHLLRLRLMYERAVASPRAISPSLSRFFTEISDDRIVLREEVLENARASLAGDSRQRSALGLRGLHAFTSNSSSRQASHSKVLLAQLSVFAGLSQRDLQQNYTKNVYDLATDILFEKASRAHAETILALCGLLGSQSSSAARTYFVDVGGIRLLSMLYAHSPFKIQEEHFHDYDENGHCSCDPETLIPIQLIRLSLLCVYGHTSRTPYERWARLRRMYTTQELLEFEIEEQQAWEFYDQYEAEQNITLDRNDWCCTELLRPEHSRRAVFAFLQSILQQSSDSTDVFRQQLREAINTVLCSGIVARARLNIASVAGAAAALDCILAQIVELVLRPFELSHPYADAPDVNETTQGRDEVEDGYCLNLPFSIIELVGVGPVASMSCSANPLVTTVVARSKLFAWYLQHCEQSHDTVLGSPEPYLWFSKPDLHCWTMLKPQVDTELTLPHDTLMSPSYELNSVRVASFPKVVSADVGIDIGTETNADNILPCARETLDQLKQILSHCKLHNAQRSQPHGQEMGYLQFLEEILFDSPSFQISKRRLVDTAVIDEVDRLDERKRPAYSIAAQLIFFLHEKRAKSSTQSCFLSASETLLHGAPISVRRWAARSSMLFGSITTVSYCCNAARKRLRRERLKKSGIHIADSDKVRKVLLVEEWEKHSCDAEQHIYTGFDTVLDHTNSDWFKHQISHILAREAHHNTEACQTHAATEANSATDEPIMTLNSTTSDYEESIHIENDIKPSKDNLLIEDHTIETGIACLAEVCRFNPAALEDLERGDCYLDPMKRYDLIRAICQYPKYSCSFLRSVGMTMFWSSDTMRGNSHDTIHSLPIFFDIHNSILSLKQLRALYRVHGSYCHRLLCWKSCIHAVQSQQSSSCMNDTVNDSYYDARTFTEGEPLEEHRQINDLIESFKYTRAIDFPRWTLMYKPLSPINHQALEENHELVPELHPVNLEESVQPEPHRIFKSEICTFFRVWWIPIQFNIISMFPSINDLSHTNIDCLNTILVFFTFAHQQRCLPALIQELWSYAQTPFPPAPYSQHWITIQGRIHQASCAGSESTSESPQSMQHTVDNILQEAEKEATSQISVISSFKSILEFWLYFYAVRIFERSSFLNATGFSLLQLREVVMLVLGRYDDYLRSLDEEWKYQRTVTTRANEFIGKSLHETNEPLSAQYIQACQLFSEL